MQRPSNNFNNQPQNFNNQPVQPADTKPFVKCPAAMKCVREENCDLEGIMVDQPIQYTPQLRMIRVALNVSIPRTFPLFLFSRFSLFLSLFLFSFFCFSVSLSLSLSPCPST